MLVVRNVFRCKPGQAKALVAKLKAAFAASGGESSYRILVDVSAGFWTVVLENHVESLAAWEQEMKRHGESPEVQKAMAGYMDLVEGGHREIFRVE